MQILKYLPLAFAALATAQSADAVAADIRDVQAKAAQLNQTVTAYKGGNDYITALKIQNQATALEKALNKTTDDANASPPYDDDQSLTVGIAVLDLKPVVIDLLDNLKNKKKTFDSGFIPLSPIVLDTLKKQRAATVRVTKAITAKVSDTFKSAAPEIVQPILDKFDEVIKAYGFSFPGTKKIN